MTFSEWIAELRRLGMAVPDDQVASYREIWKAGEEPQTVIDEWGQTVRQQLDSIIARQDAERGRSLTNSEKLANLAAALARDAEERTP